MVGFIARACSAPVMGLCAFLSVTTTQAFAGDGEGSGVFTQSFASVYRNFDRDTDASILRFGSIWLDASDAERSNSPMSEARKRWNARLQEWKERRAEFRAKRQARLGSQKSGPSKTKVKTKKPAKTGMNGLIAKYAKQHGVPYSLGKAVVQVESTFRPNVTGGSGEIGLMQIKLSTARGMGYKGSRKGLYDPATNLYWGMKYLGRAHQLAGGSTCGTILRYNAGHAAKRMNPISSRYCGKVKRILS